MKAFFHKHVGRPAFRLADFIAGIRPAVDSIRGYLNLSELSKVVMTALASGGGAYGVLLALSDHASTIFAAPYVGVASAVLAAVVQVVRLANHGYPTPRRCDRAYSDRIFP